MKLLRRTLKDPSEEEINEALKNVDVFDIKIETRQAGMWFEYGYSDKFEHSQEPATKIYIFYKRASSY